MSSFLLPIAALIGGLVGNVLLYALGLDGTLAYWPLVGACAILGLLTWAYSPLPDNTGGPIVSASGHGYWGFAPPDGGDDEVIEA